MLFLAPWIVLAAPTQVFLGLGYFLVLGIVSVGLAGMLARINALATLASVALLVTLVAAKAGTDFYGLPPY